MSFDNEGKSNSLCFKNFKLYETRSNFYMVGWEKSRNIWRVLKIDRLEPSELNILEDSAIYSEVECSDLLRRVHEGNKSTGGLKFVSICCGIVGFIKFLGAYYMLLITKRRKTGSICGHAVYTITKTEMIPIPNSTIRAKMGCSKNENRSFVNYACKCEMYLVLLFEFGNTYIRLYVDEIVLQCGGFILFMNCIPFCQVVLIPEFGHCLLTRNKFCTVEVLSMLFLQIRPPVIHQQCGRGFFHIKEILSSFWCLLFFLKTAE